MNSSKQSVLKEFESIYIIIDSCKTEDQLDCAKLWVESLRSRIQVDDVDYLYKMGVYCSAITIIDVKLNKLYNKRV